MDLQPRACDEARGTPSSLQDSAERCYYSYQAFSQLPATHHPAVDGDRAHTTWYSYSSLLSDPENKCVSCFCILVTTDRSNFKEGRLILALSFKVSVLGFNNRVPWWT